MPEESIAGYQPLRLSDDSVAEDFMPHDRLAVGRTVVSLEAEPPVVAAQSGVPSAQPAPALPSRLRQTNTRLVDLIADALELLERPVGSFGIVEIATLNAAAAALEAIADQIAKKLGESNAGRPSQEAKVQKNARRVTRRNSPGSRAKKR